MYIRKTDWSKGKVWPKTEACRPMHELWCTVASVTSAFWPTANAPRSYRFAFSCWVRNNSRKQNNNTPFPPKTVPIFGAALNVVDR